MTPSFSAFHLLHVHAWLYTSHYWCIAIVSTRVPANGMLAKVQQHVHVAVIDTCAYLSTQTKAGLQGYLPLSAEAC